MMLDIKFCSTACDLCRRTFVQCYTEHVDQYKWACLFCASVQGHAGLVWLANRWGMAPMTEVEWNDLFPGAQVDERDIQDLQLVALGKAWKLTYNRIEQLIEKGLVNATGVRLTEEGKKCLQRK